MIPPFGTPILFTISPSRETGMALQQFINLFVGPSLPYHYPAENNIHVSSAENLFYRLEKLDGKDLSNSVCIVDISLETGIIKSISEDKSSLRLSEMVLRYPEVYWIFLTEKLPYSDKDTLTNQEMLVSECHFATFSKLDNLARLLNRHANGFRTWFDPTGFRKLLRTISPNESNKESRENFESGHSAPFKNQTVASALIKRARVIGGQERTSRSGVHAALLAHEAWDILDNKTYTLSLEALNILYKMETMAECAFVGASSILPVGKRFEEIDLAINSLNENNNDNTVHIEPRYGYGAAIDEEEDFVMLNGYVLYRYGFNVYVVPSLSEMDEIFGKKNNENENKYNIQIVMEDLDLRFGDTENATTGLSLNKENRETILKDRTKVFIGLNNVCRIIVSSSELYGEKKKEEYLKEYKILDWINKPHGGVFDNEIVGRFENTILREKCENSKNITYGHRNYQKNSALIEIVDDLRQVYREFDQFEEEDKAMAKLRKCELNLKYGCDEKRFCIFSVPECYLNELISSFRKIFMMVVYWIGVFACAFWYLDINNLINNNGQIQHHSIIGWSSHSLMSFFSMQQGTFNIEAIWSNGAYWLLLDMEILFAYLHLGILIAYLYQKVSRK